ncbi:MAG: methyltransferase domain-containing protein [Verrucomicrobiales bacterium]|nr:methyltransferase domain-containing protein [Verrucomicrobiales bacterium]MDF1756674.1 methyltransferase domain-containing protein [Verrucomicrobiales bacterium]
MNQNHPSKTHAAEAIKKFAGWYHQITVAPGLETPGSHNSAEQLKILDQFDLPKDCSGLRVLDIGCRDGYFSFEMERRGASVTAIDSADPESTGFSIAASLIGSDVEYEVQNVYELAAKESGGDYDIVLFLGVLYHLRNPLLALDRIREVIKPGAKLFVETQLATAPDCIESDTPMCQFLFADTFRNDGTNKWAPNLSCLKAMVREARFEVLACESRGDRAYVHAEAVENDFLDSFRKMDSAGSCGLR